MPRIVRTARGDLVDFDALVIKQKLAEAPMNIEVERRKTFIDAKEGKVRGARRTVPETPTVAPEGVTVGVVPDPDPSWTESPTTADRKKK